MRTSVAGRIGRVYALLIAGTLGGVASQSVEIARVGEWIPPGLGLFAEAVSTSGDYAYLAGSGGLEVFYIRDPSKLVLVGALATNSYSGDLVVSGNYAYAAADNKGVQVIDVSNPTNPVVVGSTAVVGSAPRIAVSGSYAYVAADSGGGLQIIDIHNPARPVLLGRTNTGGAFESVAVSGNYAYAGVGFRLEIFDISDPTANPVPIASTNLTGLPESVAISGNYVFVSAGYSFEVFDVSTPMRPLQVGGAATLNFISAIKISGSRAYLATDSGLEVVDITNPASPVWLSASGTPGAYSVALSGSFACVAAGSAGIQVFDLSGPANPHRVGGSAAGGYVSGVARSGGYAYIADGPSGLEVLDVRNPASPLHVGGYYIGGFAQDVAVSGNYACVVDGFEGLLVIDISNPAGPVLLGRYGLTNRALNVTISGNYAYVTYTNNYHTNDYLDFGMNIIDISNPSNPICASTYARTNGHFIGGGVAVAGNYAYLAYGLWYYFEGYTTGGFLDVIDVSNPANPTLVSRHLSVQAYFGVAISGGYAYLPFGVSQPTPGTNVIVQGGLEVFNLNNPTNPLYVGSFSTNVWAGRPIAIKDNYAFISLPQGALFALDISNPTNPAPAGGAWFNLNNFALSGDYVYLVNGALEILCINCPRLTSQLSGDQLVLKWPQYASNYLLECTAGLSPPQWQTVGATPQIQNGFYTVSMPAAAPTAYFRLRRP